MINVTVIGTGITGSLVAHELSKYDLSVLVLERANDVAAGASGANSAIIHSGHDPKPNTLKCKYNLLGHDMFPDLCKELKVAYKKVGAFVVATNEEEESKLDVLVKQCIDRNVEYELLDGIQARIQEPNLSDDVSRALSLPTTGIITPWEVCMAAMEEALMNDVKLRLNYEVNKIEKVDDHFVINDGIETEMIINCTGVHADDVARLVCKNVPYKVEAKKGEYYVLDHTGPKFMSHVIYPIPSSKGKGVLVVPTIHGNTLLGPNADYEENKDDVSTGYGLDYVKKEINKIAKNVPYNKMIRNFAGVRPSIDLADFCFKEDDEIKGFVHVAGIESPGLTAAPAIAKEIVENIVLKKYNAIKKEGYDRRRPYIRMNEMSNEEKEKLIKRDPDFGKIVCRCENISEGEIKDVIHRQCGARSIKGVKMRCRPGMGRCQGSFCEPEVFKLLKQELNIAKCEVELSEIGSEVAPYTLKEDL